MVSQSIFLGIGIFVCSIALLFCLVNMVKMAKKGIGKEKSFWKRWGESIIYFTLLTSQIGFLSFCYVMMHNHYEVYQALPTYTYEKVNIIETEPEVITYAYIDGENIVKNRASIEDVKIGEKIMVEKKQEKDLFFYPYDPDETLYITEEMLHDLIKKH